MSKQDQNNDVDPLDTLLCFQLYLASRNVIKSYQETLNSIGLTYPQYLVMFVLWRAEQVSVKVLCDELGLDSGTLSPLIKRLIDKGLVTKSRDPADERGVLVSATQQGREIEAKAQCMPEVLAKASKLDYPRYKSLMAQLKELNNALQDSASE